MTGGLADRLAATERSHAGRTGTARVRDTTTDDGRLHDPYVHADGSALYLITNRLGPNQPGESNQTTLAAAEISRPWWP